MHLGHMPYITRSVMREGTVLIVGGGGREHALAIGLANSKSVSEIHVAPGNAGTSVIGTNHPVSASDIQGITKLAVEIGANLVVIGPEDPLVAGLADELRSMGIPCFGPGASGAMIEGSKQHAKKIMSELGIPTAESVMVLNTDQVLEALHSMGPPWVIKRDGLAAGKGVTVTSDIEEAEYAASSAIRKDDSVLIESFLEGEEASLLVLMDESDFAVLPASQDHKRLNDGDNGPNTGGMGAYAPAPVAENSVIERAISSIIVPMHEYFSKSESPYRGCLYVGLMIRDGAPSVVEFNARLGDPETQVTIPLIESDLGLLLLSVAEGKLGEFDLKISENHAATVVLASEGYPHNPAKGREISGLEGTRFEGRTIIHHAGTKLSNGKITSSGGRVLSATGIAESLSEAIEAAYGAISQVNLEGGHFRKDIGSRALDRPQSTPKSKD
ncbi:MAG: phosphoribosylamine--glycine ligase [Euryarchaeota archaeon]|nr:phosphoribosylamine--glycine ligase [Euryarchaeota archaeon]